MEDVENNNNETNDNIVKKFLLEIAGKFKSSSTVEFSNYEEALESFNQQYKNGKNLILYEIHKSTLDGSVIKKVPVLNTSKHAERMRALEEESKANALTQKEASSLSQQHQQSASPSSSNQKNKMTFANMKYKIIILSAVVAGLIVTLFMLNFLASGGGNGLHGHMTAYDSVQNYLQTSINGIDFSDRKLVSI